jgi:hypothetical protein
LSILVDNKFITLKDKNAVLNDLKNGSNTSMIELMKKLVSQEKFMNLFK